MKKELKYTVDGQEKVLFVVKPTSKQLSEAQLYSSRVFAKLINDKDENGKPTALLRDKLSTYMRDVGLWDDEKEQELKDIQKKILENEKLLAKGGIKLSVAKNLALENRKLRLEQIRMLAKTTELDSFTAEGAAENARFDYLVSVCLLDEDGDKLYSSVEDYKENGNAEHIYRAASELASMLNTGVDTKWEENLPENKFLKKYGFIDDKLRLVNKDGHLVDVDGKLIDENGRFIAYDDNKNKYFVDKDGNKVDDEGNPIVEFVEFLED